MIIAFLPFLFELVYDWQMIIRGKKDMHWIWRIPLFAAAILQDGNLQPSKLLLCLAPFALFDVALNLLRRMSGQTWITWYHLGTKKWDTTLKSINPILLLVGRVIVAFGLIYFYFKIQ